ncbi:MAG: carbamoyltransferase N-terminal domain-containing protein [Chitinophagales bacterium]
MYILGISAYYHDSAAALIKNGEIIAAAQEERFTRLKHDAAFPSQAIAFCLDEASITLNQLSAVVFYDKPLLKFERLLETYYVNAPKGLVSFVNAMPSWSKQKLFLRSTIRKALNAIEKFDSKKMPLLFTEHHLSHAASTFYTSPFQEAAILTIDGVGEWATATIASGKDNSITIHKELHYPDSVGLLYSALTYFLGFKVNNGEYKVMGLAPYGIETSEETQRFISLAKQNIVTIFEDGSIHLNPSYFTYSTAMKMVNVKKWEDLLGIKKREMDDELNQHHCNLALAFQRITEEIVLKLAQTAKTITSSSNICLSGGVALNCVANGKLKQNGIFENIFIQPAAGDAGGALGAALAAHYIYFEKEERNSTSEDTLKGAYLGPEYTDGDIKRSIKNFDGKKTELNDFDELIEYVNQQLLQEKVVGWFQDKMEFGPRALGNRSILADPRGIDIQRKVNLKVKFRESFRPFAPIMLKEEVEQLFEFEGESPYMLMTAPIRNSYREKLPEQYDSLPMKEKLDFKKSNFPAISHVDLSSRLQTVDGQYNPKIYKLLQAFKQATGVGMLLNTSFNIKDEPIVCHPDEAVNCFLKTDIDVLVIGNYVLEK